MGPVCLGRKELRPQTWRGGGMAPSAWERRAAEPTELAGEWGAGPPAWGGGTTGTNSSGGVGSAR